MEIEIRPIKIQLDTNIPGKPLVELKKSILYNPVLQNTTSFSEYPYFTMDVEYPSMHLNSLSYEKRLEFFFNKDTMLKTLKTFRSSYFTQPKKDEVKIETSADKMAKNDETQYEKGIDKLKDEIKKKDQEIKNKDSEKKEIDINYKPLLTLLQNVKGDLDEIFQKKDGSGRADKNTLKTGAFVNPFSDVLDSCIKYKTKYTDALKKTKNDGLIKIATDFDGKLKDFITGKKKDSEGSNIKEIMTVFEYDIEKNAGQNMEKAKSILNNLITTIDREKKIMENEKGNKQKDLDLKNKEANAASTATKEKNEIEKKKESVTMTEDEKKEIQLKNSENNIMLMLRLIFPIKYPIVGDISSSFNQIIMNKTEISTTFNDFLPAFLKNKLVPGIADYSYLKIDGKVYTITQAIWLNDIYNHKEYSKLIEQYKQLNKQKQNDSSKLISENEKLLKKFRNDYGKNSKKSLDDKAVRFFKDLFDKLDIKSSAVVETEAQKNAGLLNQFIESIKTFNESIDDEKIIDAAKNMVDIYKTLPGTFKQNTTYTNIITSMTRDIDKIRINDYIHDNYIGAPGINLNYKDDEPKYIEILKSKYSYYTSFVDSIKQFRAPAKISTNYVLQDTINDFLDNIEEYSFGKNMGPFSFMMNPYNIDVNPFSTVPVNATNEERDNYTIEKKKYKQRMNTGVTILPITSATDPKYEIFVQINVIAGELNDTNSKLVDCLYKGEMLGERLEYLLNKTLGNPWDIKSTRLFFDISQGDAKNEIVKAKAKEAIANQPIVPNQPITANQPIVPNQPIAANQMKMQGGGSLSRKMRTNLIRKTFKSYIY